MNLEEWKKNNYGQPQYCNHCGQLLEKGRTKNNIKNARCEDCRRVYFREYHSRQRLINDI